MDPRASPFTWVAPQGNFGHRQVNIKEENIPWLICIAEKADLVDEAAALAPLEGVDAEVTVFPKGPNTAIATSWSMATSECALHTCFTHRCHVLSSRSGGKRRGPVRFQLDLEEAPLRPH